MLCTLAEFAIHPSDGGRVLGLDRYVSARLASNGHPSGKRQRRDFPHLVVFLLSSSFC